MTDDDYVQSSFLDEWRDTLKEVGEEIDAAVEESKLEEAPEDDDSDSDSDSDDD